MIKGHKCKKCGAIGLIDERWTDDLCQKCKRDRIV